MIYAIKCVRYFMIIGLCLYGSSATALLKLKFNDNKSSSSQNSIPLNTLSSLPRTNFIANILNAPRAMGDYLYTIDLAACKTFVIGGAANNPEFTVVCIAACMLLTAVYAAKKLSPAKWQVFKEFFISTVRAFTGSCYNYLPPQAQTAVLYCKWPLGLLGNMIFHEGGVGVSAAIAGGTFYYGWYKLSALAVITSSLGLGLHLEAKMDANQAETNQNFLKVRNDLLDVRNDIANLGKDVTNQIKGVSGQVANVELIVKDISQKISGLEQDLKKLGNENQESFKEIKYQINEAKKSFTETLESKIELSTKQLIQKMKKSDKNRENDANYLNKQLEDVNKDLIELKLLVENFNNHSNVQSHKIDNLAATVTQDISQFTGSINQKIENLSGDVAGLKNQLNIVQETSKGINDAMQKQAAKLEDLEFKIDKVSTEVQENIKEIRKDINKFNQVAKEDAALATEKLVQQISGLGKKNKKFANKLNNELLVKIEEFIKETKAEGEALKKEVKDSIESGKEDLQVKVDGIQNKQNECVGILNVLLDSTKNQDSKVSKLVDLVNSNQKDICTLGITAQVQIETINERLDKIQGEVVANKEEILTSINQLSGKINKLDDGISKVDTIIEKALSGKIGEIQKECKDLDQSINKYAEKHSQDTENLTIEMTKIYSSFDAKLNSLVTLNSRMEKMEMAQKEQSEFNKNILKLLEEHKQQTEALSKKFNEQNKQQDKQNTGVNHMLNIISDKIDKVGQQGGRALMAATENIVNAVKSEGNISKNLGFLNQDDVSNVRSVLQQIGSSSNKKVNQKKKKYSDNPENGS